MTIGWIFFACALIILTIMALKPWLSKERVGGTLENDMFGKNQGFSARLDEFDARLQRRDEVMDFLNAGQKIQAIKVYREDTGASLADARAAVERMELTVRMGLAPGEARIAEPFKASDSLNGEIEHLLMQGKKIPAIKLYREQSGLGLREAKDAVDLIENTLLVRGPSSFQAQAGDPVTEDSLPVLEVFDEEIRQCLLKGNKIQAIKLYRQQSGLGLREAKEAIDRLEQTVRYGRNRHKFLEQGERR